LAWQIDYTRQAQRQLAKLDKPLRDASLTTWISKSRRSLIHAARGKL
jgi:mRNA-degrading endonuclease RelE of RelBE toxin-antitoxin system